LVQVKDTIDVSGVFDCEGATYRWIGAGECSQKEDMPPIFKMRDNSTLKNCFIENAPDGIHIRGSNVVIDNVVFPNVCEDAISTSSNTKVNNVLITNSQFANCGDKCLQFNPNS